MTGVPATKCPGGASCVVITVNLKRKQKNVNKIRADNLQLYRPSDSQSQNIWAMCMTCSIWNSMWNKQWHSDKFRELLKCRELCKLTLGEATQVFRLGWLHDACYGLRSRVSTGDREGRQNEGDQAACALEGQGFGFFNQKVPFLNTAIQHFQFPHFIQRVRASVELERGEWKAKSGKWRTGRMDWMDRVDSYGSSVIFHSAGEGTPRLRASWVVSLTWRTAATPSISHVHVKKTTSSFRTPSDGGPSLVVSLSLTKTPVNLWNIVKMQRL